jgi:hypothetical protein
MFPPPLVEQAMQANLIGGTDAWPAGGATLIRAVAIEKPCVGAIIKTVSAAAAHMLRSDVMSFSLQTGSFPVASRANAGGSGST